MQRSSAGPAVAWAAVGVVLAGAVQQAATALGWLSIGRDPGAWEPGHALFEIALVVLAVAGPALVALAARGGSLRAAPALALAAVLLVVARFESFDAYDAPTRRRMADDGSVSGTWVVVVVASGVAAAAVAARRERTGTALVGVVCLAACFTAAVASLGH
jgi:hypothetical protein